MTRADLRVVAALGRRSLKQTFRRPQFLAPILLFPSLFLAVNTGGAGRAVEIPGFPDVAGFLDFELAGAILQSTMLAGVSGGIALALDVEMGFIDRLVAAPIPRWAIVVGRLAGTAALGLVAAVWFLAGGLTFGARVEAGLPGVLVVLGLAPLSALGFGGLGAALALWSGRASVVQGIFPLVFVILFMSSAFFPRELLLEPASTLAGYNPLSYVAEALRDPVISELSAGPLLRGLLGLALLGGTGAAVCALALRSRLRAG
jgi:ABC-2 type transport system permease protein